MRQTFSLLREFRYHLLAILILLTIRANVHAEEQTAPTLPTSVTMMIQQADADVMKAHATLLLKLRKEQDVATKKGDLELAMWIKERVDYLQKNPTLGTTSMIWDVDVTKAAGEHSTRDVILYSEPNFKGQGVTVKTLGSVVEVYQINFPNDGLRSIKVPEGYVVTVYEGNLGAGASADLTHDMSELTGAPALGMTSFKITKRIDASK